MIINVMGIFSRCMVLLCNSHFPTLSLLSNKNQAQNSHDKTKKQDKQSYLVCMQTISLGFLAAIVAWKKWRSSCPTNIKIPLYHIFTCFPLLLKVHRKRFWFDSERECKYTWPVCCRLYTVPLSFNVLLSLSVSA